jgi:hypothetical protein
VFGQIKTRKTRNQEPWRDIAAGMIVRLPDHWMPDVFPLSQLARRNAERDADDEALRIVLGWAGPQEFDDFEGRIIPSQPRGEIRGFW